MANDREKEFDAFITVRCASPTRDSLAGMAKAESRTMSNYIRLVLEKHVAENEKAAPKDGDAVTDEPAAA